MDLNHDYISKNDNFTVDGVKDRLQRIKAAILSYGDMGYLDPPVPNILEYIGEYTDVATTTALSNAVSNIIVESCTAQPEEIIGITVDVKGDRFIVNMAFTFGSDTVEFSNVESL